jgi:uncharacterized SAM-binding protein YcdF (DUF218 family)
MPGEPIRQSRPAGIQRRRSAIRRRRLALGSCALVVIVLLGWLAACFVLVGHPRLDRPSRVDAILALGPPDVDGRAEQAYALAKAGYADTVVLSVGWQRGLLTRSACQQPNPDFKVICFVPEPGTTQGEAREIGRLAAAHHWNSVIVVTSTYHASRARMIVSRCLPGRVLMIAAPGQPSVSDWAYQYLYQSGAYLKAMVHRGC